MKLVIMDQYEFCEPSSEQSLVIASSHIRYYAGLNEFFLQTNLLKSFENTMCKSLPDSLRLGYLRYKTDFTSLLYHHYSVDLNGDERIHIINEDWDIQDYVLQFEHQYIRYLWVTTA